MSLSIDTLFNQMNTREPHFHYTTESFETIPAFIAHYSNQSYQDYLNRKIRLPRDDNGGKRNILSKEEIHKQYNKIINNYIKYKYADNYLKPDTIKKQQD